MEFGVQKCGAMVISPSQEMKAELVNMKSVTEVSDYAKDFHDYAKQTFDDMSTAFRVYNMNTANLMVSSLNEIVPKDVQI